MLAPSGPILKLTHAEETSVCHVAAYVFFGPLKNFEEDPENPGCRRICIDFEMGLWSKFSPAYSERETVRTEDFDWSQVPFSEPVTDTGRYLREFEGWWRERGQCPNPQAYEVRGSTWPKEVGAERLALRHFLLVGADAYVEVLAKNWKYSF